MVCLPIFIKDPEGLTLAQRAYARDPNLYPDPEVFKPERFLKDGALDPNVTDPSTMTFGYGRRLVVS